MMRWRKARGKNSVHHHFRYNWQSPVALLQLVVSAAKHLGCYSIPMTGIAMLQTLMLGI